MSAILDWTKLLKSFNINLKVIGKYRTLHILAHLSVIPPCEVKFSFKFIFVKWHNKVHPFILLSCTLLTLLSPSPLPSSLTPCSSFIPKVSKVLFFLNTKHHCLLNFWWWLKSKKSQKHLSIKTSQAEFRCSSPELHPYSKGIASCLFPSGQLFLLSYCYWGQKARLRSRTHKQTCIDLYKVLAAWKIGCKPSLHWTRYPKTWRLCYPGKIQLISIMSPFVLNCWSKWARDKSNMDGLYGWCLSIRQCLWGWEAKATWKG